jgi:hypothetical protein
VRVIGVDNATKADIVATAFRDHGHQFPGAFSVISPGSLRVRTPLTP